MNSEYQTTHPDPKLYVKRRLDLIHFPIKFHESACIGY